MTTLMDTVRIEVPKRSPVKPTSPLDPSRDNASEIRSPERSFEDGSRDPVGAIGDGAWAAPLEGSGMTTLMETVGIEAPTRPPVRQRPRWMRCGTLQPSHDPVSALSRSSRAADTLGPSWAGSPTSTTRRRRTWCSRATGRSSGFRCETSRVRTEFRGGVRSLPTPYRRCRGFGTRQLFRPLRPPVRRAAAPVHPLAGGVFFPAADESGRSTSPTTSASSGSVSLRSPRSRDSRGRVTAPMARGSGERTSSCGGPSGAGGGRSRTLPRTPTTHPEFRGLARAAPTWRRFRGLVGLYLLLDTRPAWRTVPLAAGTTRRGSSSVVSVPRRSSQAKAMRSARP